MGKVLLEIVVELLVRIQFRAVGGKIMDLDPELGLLKPFFHQFCVMDSRVVNDEEDFAFPVLDQLLQEPEESIDFEGLLQCHPWHLSLIVDRADDRAVEAFGRLSHDRRLALGGEPSTSMGFRLCRRLVRPPNLCVFGLRACFQTRLGLSHPLLHSCRPLFVSPLQRPLR